jgi:hypothetical protein
MRRAALLALGLALSPLPAAACLAPEADATPVILTGIDARGDLISDSGQRLRMAGLTIPPGVRAEAGRMVADIAGAAHSASDRWGRRTLSAPPSLATTLLHAGLAVTLASDTTPSCLAVYLAAEDAARRAGRGIWGDNAQRPIDARRGEAVMARAGFHALAEGRIAHVGWTRRAAYLNFGRVGEGASAELSSAVWRTLERQGWTRETLTGKTVRIRGVVSAGRRGRVLIDNVAAIEWLD